MCRGACDARGSQCPRAPPSSVRPPRWPGVGAVQRRGGGRGAEGLAGVWLPPALAVAMRGVIFASAHPPPLSFLGCLWARPLLPSLGGEQLELLGHSREMRCFGLSEDIGAGRGAARRAPGDVLPAPLSCEEPKLGIRGVAASPHGPTPPTEPTPSEQHPSWLELGGGAQQQVGEGRPPYLGPGSTPFLTDDPGT